MLYKYASWKDKYTKENLEKRYIFFNTPENFNDPFDLYAKFSIGNREFLKDLFQKEGVTEDIESLITNEQLLDFARLMDRSISINSKYGITCFSKLCNSILMWAMYADKGGGICLGFDIDFANSDTVKDMLSQIENLDKLSGAMFEIIDINYNEERPVLEYTPDYDIRELLHTKFKDWNYEEEVRIMVQGNKQYVFPSKLSYAPKYLSKIILGPMMSIKDFVEFYHLIVKKNPRIDYQIAVLDKDEYKYNILDLKNDEMEMLEANMKYLKENSNELICNITLLKEDLEKISKSKRRNSFKEVVDSIPIYYFKDTFTLFLNKEYRIGRKYSDEENFQLTTFYNLMRENMGAKLKLK